MSTQKSPISLLQELMVTKNLVPKYNEEDPINDQFVIKVQVGQDFAYGSGRTKKDAKQESARLLMEKLNLYNKSSSNKSSIKESSPNTFRNYIGELNEKANEKGLNYAAYSEAVFQNDVFTITCQFGGMVCEGKGSNKKEAKHKAAENMINSFKVDMVPTKLVEKLKIDKNDLEQILRKTQYLKIQDDTVDNKIKTNNDTKNINTKLNELMQSIGLEYSFKKIPNNKTVMLFMEIKGSSFTLLGTGDTEKCAKNDIFKKLQVFIDFGIDLKSITSTLK